MRPMRRLTGLLAASSLAAFAASTPARNGSAVNPVALRLDPYFRDLRTIQVSTRTSTLTMLFDTGGGATVISPQIAARRGCTPFGRDVGHRMTGDSVEFRQCDALEMEVGSWRARVAPVGVFDVNALLPSELPRVDGLIGLDAFRDRVVTIDWPANRISVHSKSDAEAAVRAHGVEVRLATGESGRFLSAFVAVEAARGPLWFLLDSGNMRGALVAPHVLRDARLELGPNKNASLRIGRRPPMVVQVEVTDLDIDGALGTEFLNRGPVTIDLRPARPAAPER